MKRTEHYWLWFRIGLALFNQRIELRQQSDAKEELVWIRNLMATASEIGQMHPDLRRALMSEAVSRMMSLKRRDDIRWSQSQNKIRAKILRDMRDRAVQDSIEEEVWIIDELHPHIMYGFDSHNPLPHPLRDKFPNPPVTKQVEEEYKRIMQEVYEKMGIQIPDKLFDFSPILRFESATNIQMDNELGAYDALTISRTAAFLWRAVMDMGEAARNIGSFAGRYHEHLTPEEKAAADEFLHYPSS